MWYNLDESIMDCSVLSKTHNWFLSHHVSSISIVGYMELHMDIV